MKTSYSQNSTYIRCPQYWYWKYKKKLDSVLEGASTFFGSAMDAAVMAMLKGNSNYKDIFNRNWLSFTDEKVTKPIYDNINIVYSNSDFDEYVLDNNDHNTMKVWIDELGLDSSIDPITYYKKLLKIKKNPYKKLKNNEIIYMNRCNWLSLKKKGELLLEAFRIQFMPKVTKVIGVQQPATLRDDENNVIYGLIDMVLEIKGFDKPIIFDFKTSATPYKQEQIDLSEQLTLYAAMKGKEYNTNYVGYIVACKNIPKEYVYFCKICKKQKDSRHKRCNNIINKQRCNGEWEKKIELKPEIQVLIQSKDETQINNLLNDYTNIIACMNSELVYKNMDKCNDWYGNKCIYYDLCHNNDYRGLQERG